MEHNINFYSQRGEDRWLYEQNLIKQNGFYVDVGAADPYINSNTAFLDQFNWKGLCIEPNPDYYKTIHTRNAEIFIAAVNTFDGLCNFQMNGEAGKLDLSGKSQISCFTLQSIIEKFIITTIDLLSIDIEGMEYEILHQYFSVYYLLKPEIIIAEFNSFGHIDKRLYYYLTTYHNYECIHETDFNYIYKLKN